MLIHSITSPKLYCCIAQAYYHFDTTSSYSNQPNIQFSVFLYYFPQVKPTQPGSAGNISAGDVEAPREFYSQLSYHGVLTLTIERIITVY